EISINKEGLKQRTGFIENKGQIIDQYNKLNPSVLYLLNTPGMNIQLRKTGFSYDVFSIEGAYPELKNQHIIVNGNLSPITDFSSDTSLRSYRIHRIDFDFVGSNPACNIVKHDPSPDYQNYYTTGTSVEGVTRVRSFKSVTYKNIYPKIDLEFYSGAKSAVKYNFVIHPGGKLSSIKIRISDPEIQISSVGSILLKTTSGTIEEAVPNSLYNMEGIETPVNAMFAEISQGVYGFLVDRLVPSQATLIIDPVPVRLWGTYYGGTDDDIGFTSVVDNAGFCYMAGRTYSASNIASTGAYQVIMGGFGDAFFAKFSPSGQRIWATYYGGMASEEFHGMSMTPDVKLILSGITGSPNNISTPGSFQPTLGSFGSSDAFLVKFDTSGARIWGTYYGGTQPENGSGCATDANGNIYLSGTTSSPENISTPGSHQPNPGLGNDLFLVKFTPGGNRIWGTYYGGECSDNASPTNNCAVEGNSRVYICGSTCSLTNMSTVGSFQFALGGSGDGLLVQFDTSGVRQWGTYCGGPLNDMISYVKVANNSRILIAGGTTSESGIASPGAFQTIYGGGTQDGFLGRFYPNGQRHWISYYGGSNYDYINGGDFDSNGNLYFCGYTESLNSITTADGFQPVFGGGINDGMLVKFDSIGNRIWGTYYGGEAIDDARSFNYFDNNNLFLTGGTGSMNNISTNGTQQNVYGGGYQDSYLVKFSDCPLPGTAAQIIGPGDVCLPSTSIQYSVSGIPGTTTYFWEVPLGAVIVSGQNSTSITVDFNTGAVSGLLTVTGINQCGAGASKTMAIQVHSPSVPTITGTQSVCAGETKSYTTESGQTGYGWTFSAGGALSGGGTAADDYISITWNNTGIQWVSVNYTDINGCTAVSATQLDIDVVAVIPIDITITASASTICAGTSVIYNAFPTNPGLAPVYRWKVNGINSGTNSTTFSYTPVDTDIVTCELTSSLTVCISNNPATSNGITMTVNPNLPVSVTVTPTINPLCAGTSVTFTANPTHGGSLPDYQWKVNAVNISGATNSTYTYIPLNGDIITCELTSSDNCV
ncbi:MAG: hypothetical protein WCK34_17215, partial [Bacteroidota bacterium]